jgi:hypothetical protein
LFRSIHTDLSTFKTFLHFAYAQDLVDDLDVQTVLQTPLGVADDVHQFIRIDTQGAEFADDMEQKLNTI